MATVNMLSSNTNDKLLKAFTKNFMSDTVLFQTCGSQIVEDYDADCGGVVKMKRPTRYVPQRTNDGDLTSGSVNPISVGNVLGEVGQYITVFTEMTDLERALELGTDEALNDLLRPVATDMGIALESELGERMIAAAALSSGNINTPITAWSAVAGAGALLKEVGAPAGNMFTAISSFTGTALADANTTLGVNPNVNQALQDASIKGKYAGFESVLQTNNLPTVTHGSETQATLVLSAAPTQTYAAAKDSMQMLLSFTGGDNGGILTAGTQLRFATRHLVNMRNHKTIIDGAGAEIGFTVTVLEDNTADGSGVYTGVKVSGASVFEAGVDGAFNTIASALAISDNATVIGTALKTYRPALAYCGKDFFGCGSLKLKPLYNKDSRVISDPQTGLSIRLTKDAETRANKNMARWDLVPTFACYNPFLGVQLGG